MTKKAEAEAADKKPPTMTIEVAEGKNRDGLNHAGVVAQGGKVKAAPQTADAADTGEG